MFLLEFLGSVVNFCLPYPTGVGFKSDPGVQLDPVSRISQWKESSPLSSPILCFPIQVPLSSPILSSPSQSAFFGFESFPTDAVSWDAASVGAVCLGGVFPFTDSVSWDTECFGSPHSMPYPANL